MSTEMKYKKSILLLLLASTTFFLTGCNGDPDKTVQGAWQSEKIIPLEQKTPPSHTPQPVTQSRLAKNIFSS